jgi:AcrR family transcriptional regulator
MARDRRILDAAVEVFFEKGFHGAGVDEIGRRAGLSGPAIYRHFTGKDEILAALLQEALQELDEATGRALSDGASPDLGHLLRHHIDFAVRRRKLLNVYQREDRNLVDPWRREFATTRAAYIRKWELVLETVLPGADQEPLAVLTQTLLGIAFSVAFWPSWVVRSGDPVDRLIAFTRSGLLAAVVPSGEFVRADPAASHV